MKADEVTAVAARAEGFAQGRDLGRAEGYTDGYAAGVKAERERCANLADVLASADCKSDMA